MTDHIAKRAALAEAWNMTPDQLEVVRRQCISENAPDDILELYLQRCRMYGADPFSKLLYVVNRQKNVKDDRTGQWHKEDNWVFQSGIDLARSIADSHGEEYAGQLGPLWTANGVDWVDVWLRDEAPRACKIAVLRKSFREPLWVTGTYAYYVPRDRNGNETPTAFWKGEKAAHQLAKCVEMLALRKAFPQKLRGLYGAEEMEQADRAPGTLNRPPVEEPRQALNAAQTDFVDAAFGMGEPESPESCDGNDLLNEPKEAPRTPSAPPADTRAIQEPKAASETPQTPANASPAELRKARASINALLNDPRLTPWEQAEAIVSVIGPGVDLKEVKDLDALREVYKALLRARDKATNEIPL